MGATTFYNKTRGTNATEAFNDEHEASCYENGNGGYTGTLAEKPGFTMSKKPKNIDADVWIDLVENMDTTNKEQTHYELLKHDFDVYDDKWENALCVPTEDGFIFCGWASE